jgi:hypothetical protein
LFTEEEVELVGVVAYTVQSFVGAERFRAAVPVGERLYRSGKHTHTEE